MGSRRTLVTCLLIACATAVAHASPQSLCRACERACCGERLVPSATATMGGADEATCPLCRSAAEHGQAGTAPASCRCQAEPRPDTPVAPARTAAPDADTAVGSLAAWTMPPESARLSGVSRAYLASSLAIPIRPPRILFGVWRN